MTGLGGNLTESSRYFTADILHDKWAMVAFQPYSAELLLQRIILVFLFGLWEYSKNFLVTISSSLSVCFKILHEAKRKTFFEWCIWIQLCFIRCFYKPAIRNHEVKARIFLLTFIFPDHCSTPSWGLETCLESVVLLKQLCMCSCPADSGPTVPRSPRLSSTQSPHRRAFPSFVSLEILLDSCGILTGIPPAAGPSTHGHTHTHTWPLT